MPPDGVVGIDGGMPVELRDGVGGAGSLAGGGFGKVVLLGKVDLAQEDRRRRRGVPRERGVGFNARRELEERIRCSRGEKPTTKS